MNAMEENTESAMHNDRNSDIVDKDFLINTLSGGVMAFKISSLKHELIYCSTGAAEFIGYTVDEFYTLVNESKKHIIYPEDEKKFIKKCIKCIEEKTSMDCTYRLHHKNGSLLWTRIQGKVKKDKEGCYILQIVISNISENVALDEKLNENEQTLRAAISNANMYYWEYDLNTDTVYPGLNLFHNYGKVDVITDFPESWISQGNVYKDDIEDYRENILRVKNGESNVQWESRCYDFSSGKYIWLKLFYTILYDKHNNPIKAIGTALDIHEMKELEQRYLGESEYHKNIAATMIVSCRVNVTRNIVEDYWIGGHEAMSEKIRTQANYKERLTNILDIVKLSEEDNNQVSVKVLLEQFNKGIRSISKRFIARKKGDEMLIWVNLEVRMVSSPINGDIIAFFYSRDVTKSVMTTMTTSSIAKSNCDLLGYIEAINGFFYVDISTGDKIFKDTKFGKYNEFVSELINERVVPEERERVMKEQQLENVIRQLEIHSKYSSRYRYIADDGQIHLKVTQYAYGDDTHEFIIFSRIDNTEIFMEEERKQQELHNALESARIANRAKTEFMSNMSHDIRTPMNTIVNLARFVKDEIDNKKAAIEDLDKITTSAEFLLSLINDILDVSRIENGKLELKKEKYSYDEFWQYMISTIRPLCTEKNITFNIDNNDTTLAVLTDKVRFNQIFVNLLSNAVKYTERDGHVTLKIENGIEENKVIPVNIYIIDDGIGMSDEFQKRMFQPFEQEGRALITKQGTGLGLTIVREIISAMNGSIEVKSKLNEGTKVHIHLDLEMAEPQIEDKNECNIANYVRLKGKKIMLVEDHPMNQMIATRILENVGVDVTIVENGLEAVNLFKEEGEKFDAILMDLRMPVMDGLTATKTIRMLPVPSAKIVPIIAMTANAYKEDMKATHNAGMNAHLSKPVNPEMLYETLMEWTY